MINLSWQVVRYTFLHHTYEYNAGDFVFQCFGLFITITSGCRVVENNVFLGQAQQLAARECGVSYIGLAELPQEHNVHFCSRFTIADNAHHNTFGNWMHWTCMWNRERRMDKKKIKGNTGQGTTYLGRAPVRGVWWAAPLGGMFPPSWESRTAACQSRSSLSLVVANIGSLLLVPTKYRLNEVWPQIRLGLI